MRANIRAHSNAVISGTLGWFGRAMGVPYVDKESAPLWVMVCGYGLYNAELRTVAEMHGYTEYLERVCLKLQQLHKLGKLAGVVLCGGVTNPRRPFMSEAATMEFFLRARLGPLLLDVPVLKEERSTTTEANVFYGLMEILDYRLDTDAATIVCHFAVMADWHRREKADCLSVSISSWLNMRFARNSSFLFRTVCYHGAWGFPRLDIHPRSNFFIQTGVGLKALHRDKDMCRWCEKQWEQNQQHWRYAAQVA